MENVGLCFYKAESLKNGKKETLTRVLGGDNYESVPQMEWYALSSVSYFDFGNSKILKKEMAHCDTASGVELYKQSETQVECDDFFKDYYDIVRQVREEIAKHTNTNQAELQEGKCYVVEKTYDEEGSIFACGRCLRDGDDMKLDCVSVDCSDEMEWCDLAKEAVSFFADTIYHEVSEEQCKNITDLFDKLIGAFYNKYFAPCHK